jgi:hypothetical protein
MTATLADYFDELPAIEIKKEKQPHEAKPRYKARTYSPDIDIVLWLTNNAPQSFQEMIDVRYCLYHRCSRAGFTVVRRDETILESPDDVAHCTSSATRLVTFCYGNFGYSLVRTDGVALYLGPERTEPSPNSSKYFGVKYGHLNHQVVGTFVIEESRKNFRARKKGRLLRRFSSTRAISSGVSVRPSFAVTSRVPRSGRIR